MNTTKSKIGYSIFLVVGILLFSTAVYTLKNSLSFISAGNKTTGTVIDLEKTIDRRGSTLYQAVFKFKTPENKEIIFKENGSSSFANFKLGEEVKVVYDVADPSNAEPLTYFGVFRSTIILISFAMPMLVFCGGYFLAQIFFKQV